jgi:hypothetical protein
VLSSEEILNHNKSRKTRKRDRANSNKEKKDKKATEEEQSQKMKLPPIIYDPDKNQRNILLTVDDNNSFKQGQEHIRDIKEITNYYLELHKNMINTYNSIYSQILQNSSSLSWDVFFTDAGKFTNYPFDIKNMYISVISNRDKSLKLVDNIVTENLDTFIKSIELTQKFYKDIIQSYLNCIKKS